MMETPNSEKNIKDEKIQHSKDSAVITILMLC